MRGTLPTIVLSENHAGQPVLLILAGSVIAGSYLVLYFGWAGAFGSLAVFPMLGTDLLMASRLQDETPQDAGARGAKAAAISARV